MGGERERGHETRGKAVCEVLPTHVLVYTHTHTHTHTQASLLAGGSEGEAKVTSVISPLPLPVSFERREQAKFSLSAEVKERRSHLITGEGGGGGKRRGESPFKPLFSPPTLRRQ